VRRCGEGGRPGRGRKKIDSPHFAHIMQTIPRLLISLSLHPSRPFPLQLLSPPTSSSRKLHPLHLPLSRLIRPLFVFFLFTGVTTTSVSQPPHHPPLTPSRRRDETKHRLASNIVVASTRQKSKGDCFSFLFFFVSFCFSL
jgi:hypothetical protein